MPPSLPPASGADVVKALQRLGFTVIRQKGSHVVMRRGPVGCVVPQHRELKVGTLGGVLKQAGIGADEFMKALK
ncbi:MAG: type II toxin-antitoxin system HicA family toxin [Rhodanobacteraceae bacterium]|nr:type II toxin-antitoxin system HicA family toxin [Rhodanobacteraceae bacterium]